MKISRETNDQLFSRLTMSDASMPLPATPAAVLNPRVSTLPRRLASTPTPKPEKPPKLPAAAASSSSTPAQPKTKQRRPRAPAATPVAHQLSSPEKDDNDAELTGKIHANQFSSSTSTTCFPTSLMQNCASESALFAANNHSMKFFNADHLPPSTLSSFCSSSATSSNNNSPFYNNQPAMTTTATISSSTSLQAQAGHPLSSLLSQQQHASLGKSDRMSKEKQKFFRHSVFNSDRSGSSVNGGSPNKLKLHSSSESVRHFEETANGAPLCNGGPSKPKATGKKTKHESSSNSDSDSSCSSSDDENGSSSSDSSSSSDNDDSSSSSTGSYSSSSSSGSSTDDQHPSKAKKRGDPDTSRKLTPSCLNEQNSMSSHSRLSWPATTSASKLINGFMQSPFGSKEKAGDKEWGFAAEAKKQIDVFSGQKLKAVQSSPMSHTFGTFGSIKDGAKVTSSTLQAAAKAEPKKRGRRRKVPLVEPPLPANDSIRGRPHRLSSTEEIALLQQPPIVFKETRRTYKDYEKMMQLKNAIVEQQKPKTTIETNALTATETFIERRQRRASTLLEKSNRFSVLSTDEDEDRLQNLSPSKLVKRAISNKRFEPSSNTDKLRGASASTSATPTTTATTTPGVVQPASCSSTPVTAAMNTNVTQNKLGMSEPPPYNNNNNNQSFAGKTLDTITNTKAKQKKVSFLSLICTFFILLLVQ
jgi:hypothetical protein